MSGSCTAQMEEQLDDISGGRIDCGGKTYRFNPLGEIAQELVVEGGFEAVIRRQIGSGA